MASSQVMLCNKCCQCQGSSCVEEIEGRSSLASSDAYPSPVPSLDPTDVSVVLAYCVKGDEEHLKGPAVHSGQVLRLVGSTLQTVTLTLRSNGFSVEVPANKASVSRLLSPFTSVTKCDVEDLGEDVQPDAAFKVTTIRVHHGCQSVIHHCFAAVGQFAKEDCLNWMQKFADAVGNVTRSLFPRGQVKVQPLSEAPWTERRLLAGYLLQCDSRETVSVPYVELQANRGSKALFTAYGNSRCQGELWHCMLSEHLNVHVWEGLNCGVFKVNERFFCARTEDEKQLWIRALSNMKVKLLANAPDPTSRQLEEFREAVQERVRQMRDQNDDEAKKADPLLPPRTVQGLDSENPRSGHGDCAPRCFPGIQPSLGGLIRPFSKPVKKASSREQSIARRKDF